MAHSASAAAVPLSLLSFICCSFRALVRELQAYADDIEVLTDLHRRSGGGDFLHLCDAVVDLQFDVVVEVPVEPNHEDALFTARNAGLGSQGRRGGRNRKAIFVPVEIRVAVSRGEFPRAPRVARERERTNHLRRTEAANLIVAGRYGVGLRLTRDYPGTFYIPA